MFQEEQAGCGEVAGDVGQAVRTGEREGGLAEDEKGRVGKRSGKRRADCEVGVNELRSLVLINLKCCEVIGTNPELYGCGDVVDVCGDVEFNVCEWGTIEV